MSEDLIIRHCSPTLAGIKTANLFSCPYTSKKDVFKAAEKFNSLFNSKGVMLVPLRFENERVLVYIFRPLKLAKDLSDERAVRLLKGQGYSRFDISYCLKLLKLRINSASEFPHEIGLFLGYPPEDVQGFILHKGNCCKFSGCWKVYGNEEKAVREFRKFKKCSDIYYSKWLQGTSIGKLTVAHTNLR